MKILPAFLTIDYLLQLGGILIGSRAFDIETVFTSDFDIVITERIYKNYSRLFTDDMKNTAVDLKEYFNVIPPMSNDILIKTWLPYKGGSDNSKEYSCDIIIYKNESDVEKIKIIMEELKQIPSYLLQEKDLRVRLFQESLLHYGFVMKEGMNDPTKVHTVPY